MGTSFPPEHVGRKRCQPNLQQTRWFTNFGQLRRNTDRRIAHRHAELNLAIAVIITVKLIDWANRWPPIH